MSSRRTDPNLQPPRNVMARQEDRSLTAWVILLFFFCAALVALWTWWGGYWG